MSQVNAEMSGNRPKTRCRRSWDGWPTIAAPTQIASARWLMNTSNCSRHMVRLGDGPWQDRHWRVDPVYYTDRARPSG